MNGKAVILMGSKKDLKFSREIAKYLKLFGIEYCFRVASAHKTPRKLLDIIREFESEKIVYITVAGRSNALSAFVDSSTTKPVIACPPYSEKYGGADIYSSIRVPSGIGCLLTVEPEGAAIAVAKILTFKNEELAKTIMQYQLKKKKAIEEADEELKNAS